MPESLDSLICRLPKVFGRLRTVILDEIYLVDNTYRGDELRLLLKRLLLLTEEATFSIHLPSATLADPQQVASRYTGAFEVLEVTGQRGIDYYLLTSRALCSGSFSGGTTDFFHSFSASE